MITSTSTSVWTSSYGRHTNRMPGTGDVLHSLGKVGAHQKADVRVGDDLDQLLGNGETPVHVPHPHLAAAVNAEEHPRQVHQFFREPEIVDVVHGESGHLVHEDVTDFRTQAFARFQHVPSDRSDGTVFPW